MRFDNTHFLARYCFYFLAFITLLGCKPQPQQTSSISEATPTSKPLRIAVIPKTTAHIFWNSVKAGAEKAAQEIGGIEIIWKAPTKESDRAAQIQLVQQLVADKVDAVVLAPLDSKALVIPVQEATQAGVKVVIIDSALDAPVGKDYASYVATNNTLGGQLGGEALINSLDGKGDIVMMRYMVGSAATMERETGFQNAISKAPDIKVISDSQYSGTTSSEAQSKALNMIDTLKLAAGIFTPNESSTDGMLQALRKEGLIKKVKFVGFDSSPPLIQALRDGEIDALVAQNPTKMGYIGVKNAVAAIRNESFEANVDTGVVVITKDNIDSDEIVALLK
jgi:ribose transport system substrate-binding protein